MEQNNQQNSQQNSNTSNPNQHPNQNQNQNQNPVQNQAPAPMPAPQPQQPKPQQPQQQQKPNNQKPMAGAPATAQSKKNLIISGIVILVVLVLLLLVPHLKKTPAAPGKNDADTEEVGTDGQTDANGAAAKPAAQPRTEALASYQGKMITITDDCKVTPDKQTQTAGTTILLDNEGTTRHQITVGPKAYTVSGLHYTLSWLNLMPGTLMITCDGKDTGSTITLK